ncbi:MAG TPA: protoheme IX farnesyltransferase [Dissulfurispiraceae bacterium]
MRTARSFIKAYLELCKAPIAVSAAFSSSIGYLLASHRLTVEMIPIASGVFLLGGGSCALNQYIERDLDACMDRTRRRPLPTGRISPARALAFSLVLVSAGLFLLLIAAKSPEAALAGLLAAFWYNGIYTPLKRGTVFAAVPGALTGAIPPALGWIAAGAHFPNSGILFLCSLFFIWQVPHYWLLLIKYGREYEKAGLPSLTSRLSAPQFMRISVVWVCATAIGGLLTFLYGLISSFVAVCLVFAGSFLLVLRGIKTAKGAHGGALPLFNSVNFYMLFVLVLVSIERLAL